MFRQFDGCRLVVLASAVGLGLTSAALAPEPAHAQAASAQTDGTQTAPKIAPQTVPEPEKRQPEPGSASATVPAPVLPTPASAPAQTSAGLRALVAAYPAFLERVEGNDLIWKDGTRMPIDDGNGVKTFDALLNTPDIKDQFVFRYEPGQPARLPGLNEDPGRIRYAPLFNKMYGDCTKGEVMGQLVSVDWLPKHNGGKVKITSVNGVADKLAAVSKDLDELPDAFLKYLKPNSGTYNCRVIAGTTRVSAHGHGYAIDVNSDESDYWQWTKPDAAGAYPYKNRVPYEIVAIFEKHGFVWGGKWYHYDTMHFEYRPELLPQPKPNQ